MADVSIREFAGAVGVSVEKLLSQIKEAGLPHTEADHLISNADKSKLLVYLRKAIAPKKTPRQGKSRSSARLSAPCAQRAPTVAAKP